MLVKTITIEELPDKGKHECGAWCKDPGFHADTHTVECVEDAFYSTTYTHWGVDGREKKKTRKFWCPSCLPERFRPFMAAMG